MRTRFRFRVLTGFGALVMAFLLVVPSIGAQQGGLVTGRVLDASTGQPIPAVQVFISSLDLGGLTQQNGRYLLQNVPAGTHTLLVARIGYRTAEVQITVGGGQTVEQNFAITEEALQLDEIIVTGTPGGTQRRAIGNSVTRLDAASITELVSVTSVQQLLTARSPGLNFAASTGQVGGGTSIRIRGVSSMTRADQPLIYVDGVRVDNDGISGVGGGVGPNIGDGRQASALNAYNPDDIESIEIIKGPAAATLYGTEASAGVIQIITKKGRTGAPQWDFMVRQGSNFMRDPAGVLGTHYGCSEVGGSAVRRTCDVGNLLAYNPYDGANEWIANNRNALGDVFQSGDLFNNGLAQAYSMSVRGGTDEVRYFLSAQYQDEQGIVDWNTDTNVSVRANINVVASESLGFDISSTYIQGNTRYASPVAGQGGVWSDLVWGRYGSYDVLTDADGNALPSDDRGRFKNLHVFQEHLPSTVAGVQSKRRYNRFTGSITANHSYGGWLTQRLILGMDKVWDTNTQLFPLNPVGEYPENALGQILHEVPQEQNVTFDYAASGVYLLDDTWEFTTSIGAQYYTQQDERLSNTGREFSNSLQTTINQSNVDQVTLTYRFRENKQLGIYVQEQIGWNGIAFVTAAIRADDNSTFGSGFDLEYYPKVSGTVVVSDLDFWNVDQINQLRLRAAWGKAGRQPGTFDALNLYTAFPGPGGAPGITPQTPGNEAVGPEVSTEIEVGVDFALLDDLISGEFTFFSQATRGALINRGLPGSVGFPGSVTTNLGRLDNQGWEAILNLRIVDLDNVRFDLTVAGDHTINNIKKLGDVPEGGDLRVGHPFPTHRGNYIISAESSGDGTFTNAMCDSGISDGPFPGNVLRPGGPAVACNIVDVDMQERLDNILYGVEYPTYTFNVAPTLTLFNDLQIYANVEGQYGRWQYNIETAYGNVYRNTLMSWRKDDPNYLAGSIFGSSPDRRYYGMVPADFWKLREIGFRYQLPASLLASTGVERASISVTGRDLLMIWQKTDVDLAGSKIYNVEDTSTNIWAFPQISRIDITLRVTL